jgi:acylphosphatase
MDILTPIYALIIVSLYLVFLYKKKSRIRIFIPKTIQPTQLLTHIKQGAKSSKVKGWAKILPGRKIEIVAEGNKFTIMWFMWFLTEKCKKVKTGKIEVKKEKYTGEFKNFKAIH